MSKGLIATLAVVGAVVLSVIVVAVMYVSTSNTEIRLRNQISAVQTDNTNEFDLMWKKIQQVAQVTQTERESVERIIIGYADERTSNSSGSFINAVREALPNIDNSTFTNLQNIIVSSRDRFANRQKQLIDLKREHDNILLTFPGSLFVGGRPQIEITIVTSSRTQEAFQTGVDDNVGVFSAPAPSSVER